MHENLEKFVSALLAHQRVKEVCEEQETPLVWVNGLGLTAWFDESPGREIEKIDCNYPTGAFARIRAKLFKLFKETLDVKGFLVVYACRDNDEIYVETAFGEKDLDTWDFTTAYQPEDVKGYEGKVFVGYDN